MAQHDDTLAGLLARPAAPAARKAAAPHPGMIGEDAALHGFILVMRLLAWALVLWSVLGTFYGARALPAPILDPLHVLRDARAAAGTLLLAALGQGLLSLIQWGSRVAGRRIHPAWWLAYLASLGLSAWWNWAAYGAPLVEAHVPWALALGLVVAGDVLPEWVIVKE
jgi:hypothetical protein